MHQPGYAQRRNPFFVLMAAAMVATSTLLCTPVFAHAPQAPPGWKVEFVDDFDGRANDQPSRSVWHFTIGRGWPGGPDGWGNNEVQYYTDLPSNSRMDGHGELHITPQRDGLGNWTSARIQTRRESFKAPPKGIMRAQARIRLPAVTGDAALGYWPAFWMLGGADGPAWPAAGEFDIMENVNGLDRHWGVLHCGVAPGGPCNENNGTAVNQPCPGTRCQDDFHTYAFEWDRSVSPEQMRWYIDGQIYHRVDETMLPPGTWNDIRRHDGFMILLNVAIGGAFPDGLAGYATPVLATESGHPMRIDYVAVWTSDDGRMPFAPASPASIGTADAF
jgi:beta-glucanase (GH16 family)